jgi:hypothetical protein
MRVESRERLVHPTDARVFVRLVRRGLSTQLLVQPAASGVRTGLVCEHPPRRRIEPRPRIIPGRHFAKAPPRDQKDLRDRIFRVGKRARAPTAVRGDARHMSLEQASNLWRLPPLITAVSPEQ